MYAHKWSLVQALLVAACAAAAAEDGSNGQDPTATTPQPPTVRPRVDVTLIPKFDGLLVFDQAHSGAYMAHLEVGNPGIFEYLPPPRAEGSGAYQIDLVRTVSDHYATTSTTDEGADRQNAAIMLSNNAGDDVVPAARGASEGGTAVVTWDSPIPMGVPGGESLFVSQVDFDETGTVMADMALAILGEEGGEFAILSASRKAANQNAWNDAMVSHIEAEPEKYGSLKLVEIAFGDDDDAMSYDVAVRLVEKYPTLGLIVSPTTIGIRAAARAMTDLGRCGVDSSVKVTGLGLPSEMLDYTLSGCVPLFALWSFVDLGYLTYHAAYQVAVGTLEVREGNTFEAGRLGTFTIERDPTRVDAYRVIMGGFTLYDEDNVDAATFFDVVQGDGGMDSFEERYMEKYKKKALAIIPKVTGMVSFISSAYIVGHVLRRPQLRSQTLNRLLVGISAHDMVSSLFGFFLSTWPMPTDTWLVWGNVGTTQTCTMQGFFFQGGIGAAPFYSAALSTFYFLNVVAHWPKERIVRAEPCLHAVPIVFGWGTAIAGLPLKLYNAADRVGLMCWIAEYPPYCSLRSTCERGENANAYRWGFLYVEVLIVFFYMIMCNSWIYCKVLSVERATDRWTRASQQRRRRSKSRKVASQGFYYVAAFLLPWVFGITVNIMKNQSYGDFSKGRRFDNAMTALEICNAIIWPLRGFFNLLVYVRPRRRRVPTSPPTGTQTQDGAAGVANEETKRVRTLALSIKSFVTFSMLRHSQKPQGAARQPLRIVSEEILGNGEEAKNNKEIGFNDYNFVCNEQPTDENAGNGGEASLSEREESD